MRSPGSSRNGLPYSGKASHCFPSLFDALDADRLPPINSL
jgi:hypothetical protein